jgi:hypothetical protein
MAGLGRPSVENNHAGCISPIAWPVTWCSVSLPTGRDDMTFADFKNSAATAPRIESACGLALSAFLKANGAVQYFLNGGEVSEFNAEQNFLYIMRRA